MVAAGEWRDYAIDFLKDRAVFSIFRRASEVPIYRIEKDPRLARKQGAYSVISATGLIVKRGHELEKVLRAVDKSLKLVATWPGLVLAHCTLAVPFAVRIMTTAISAVPAELEAAARTLGSSPLRAALRVTLPLSMPGVLAAAALAFLVSFDETVISLFLVGPRLTTLPVELFRYA